MARNPQVPKLLMKVLFLDEDRGFAIGAHKPPSRPLTAARPGDSIAAAGEPHTDAEYTVYNNISFVNPNRDDRWLQRPPRPGDTGKPDWLDAQNAITRHSGLTCRSCSTPAMAARPGSLPPRRCSAASPAPFSCPTDVVSASSNSPTLSSGPRRFTCLTERPAKATSSTTPPTAPSRPAARAFGHRVLAGVEVEARLQHSPIPRKLKILKSENLTDWQEMDVDYRATAVRAMLRSAPDGSLFAATDNGMILKLTPYRSLPSELFRNLG